MNPTITEKYEEGAQTGFNPKLHFTLTDIGTPIANALRRTILSDIPVVCIRTETSQINKCTIDNNSSRFHNELVKQRLSCIPIHTEDPEFAKKHILEVDVKNDTDTMRWVTTEDFKIKDIDSEHYLDKSEVRKIFPPNEKTQCFIDFLRLRPAIGPTVPGEQLKLSAEFSVSTAKENGMFNSVSTCSYHNKMDKEKADEAWNALQKKHEADKMPDKEVQYEKKNFYALQAHRYFHTDTYGEPNAFDFMVQSIGIYENTAIVHKACAILIGKFADLMKNMEADTVMVYESQKTREHHHSVTESTIPFCYDVILEKEDYTVGCVLEALLYNMYYKGDVEETMTFVGFKKYHPHDTYSVVRIAYKEHPEKIVIKANVQAACKQAVDIFEKIKAMFRS